MLGSLLVMFSWVVVMAILPTQVFRPNPSPNAHQYTAQELKGREIYLQNGCVYCHSQDVRPMDWGMGQRAGVGAGGLCLRFAAQRRRASQRSRLVARSGIPSRRLALGAFSKSALHPPAVVHAVLQLHSRAGSNKLDCVHPMPRRQDGDQTCEPAARPESQPDQVLSKGAG